MKFCSALLVFLFTITGFSQEKFSKEFSFVSDNDLYVSSAKDQYYTNGLFFTYRAIASDFGNLTKKIYEFQIGHEIYTPFKPTTSSILGHDRPFAAYLYGSFGVIRAYQNNTILKSNVQLGVVGPDAYGEELQDFIHDIYNFKEAVGWKYQINNTLAVNIDLEYAKALNKTELKYTDINFISKIRFGTIFNELTAGFMGRIGFKKLQKLDNSIVYNTHLNSEKSKNVRGIESFIYYEPSITYVLYDATIEGSLFNDKSPVTFNPKAIRLDLEIGYLFTSRKWVFGYVYHIHSDKLNNLRGDGGNDYGRLRFSYLFN